MSEVPLYEVPSVPDILGNVTISGEVHKTRRCRGVTYPESYITKRTTYTKKKYPIPVQKCSL